MSNWATLYRQPTRLPTVPVGADPRAEWFKCERYECRLPKTGCANRFRLAQQRTREGLAYTAVQYGGCASCNVGAAHAAGLPTPPFEQPVTAPLPVRKSMDDIALTRESLPNGHSQKTYPERKCAKCREAFQPLTALERRCPGCSAAAAPAPKSARGKKGPAKLRAKQQSRGAVVVDLPTANAIATGAATPPHRPIGAPSKSGALAPSKIATATELLELAGYKVASVHTPAGEFLRVLE